MKLNRFTAMNEGFSTVFEMSDFLIVDALDQLLGEQPLSDSAALVVLLLAKAVRLNHVALPLDTDALGRLVSEQLWGELESADFDNEDDGEEERAHQEGATPAKRSSMPPLRLADIDQGVRDLEGLAGAVIEINAVGDGVGRQGPPVLITKSGDSAKFVAFRRFAFAEHVVATALVESAQSERCVEGFDRDHFLTAPILASVSAEAQKAIRNAVSRRLSVLTGGPGRGKTTVIATLLIALHFESRHSGRIFRVALGAPTAKAAVRMRLALAEQVERLGISMDELQTSIEIDERSGSIHRLLGIRPDNTKSLRTLDHDLVIVDEVSMLEFTLMAKVLEHSPRANVVFVGDADQLASVDVGAALRDVVQATRSAGIGELITELTVNHRSNKELDELATAIKSGELAKTEAVIKKYPNSIRWSEKYSDVVPAVASWAEALKQAGRAGDAVQGLALLSKLCVLCATRQGHGSVAFWRERVERVVSDVVGSPGRFRVGAPVLITENEQSLVRSVDEQLANGDVGIVLQGSDGHDVYFGPSGAPRVRKETHIGASETAWSMTIHKSQGSEYEEVVVSLPKSSSRALSRELLYTAVTRAKERVTIVGSRPAFEQALKESIPRASGLVERVSALTKDRRS
jgi:exodeoxyribonuclease V alpha subunit